VASAERVARRLLLLRVLHPLAAEPAQADHAAGKPFFQFIARQ
jgi:hypothetical protein